MARRRWVAASLIVGVMAAGTSAALVILNRTTAPEQGSARTSSTGPGHSAKTPRPGAAKQSVYLHYYLWWTPQHWKDKLGPAYPHGAGQPPIPGQLDADGCNPKVMFPKSELVDLPAEGTYDQNQSATFTYHVDLAWRAGVRGFLVSWQGTGSASQQPASSGYDSRLDLLVKAVDAYNAAHQSNFRLGLAFAAYGDFKRPAEAVVGDLTYFQARYGRDPAFNNPYDARPIVMWLDSRKFAVDTVKAVAAAVRPQVYLVGDETYQSWPRDADYLDASSYYWSTENPWLNAQAGTAISKLALAVRARGKRWFAPFIAGYDKQLLGGTCVPRRGTETLAKVWHVNAASHPDAWFGISWNEMVENTYLEPSRAYGTRYLDTLSQLMDE